MTPCKIPFNFATHSYLFSETQVQLFGHNTTAKLNIKDVKADILSRQNEFISGMCFYLFTSESAFLKVP